MAEAKFTTLKVFNLCQNFEFSIAEKGRIKLGIHKIHVNVQPQKNDC